MTTQKSIFSTINQNSTVLKSNVSTSKESYGNTEKSIDSLNPNQLKTNNSLANNTSSNSFKNPPQENLFISKTANILNTTLNKIPSTEIKTDPVFSQSPIQSLESKFQQQLNVQIENPKKK